MTFTTPNLSFAAYVEQRLQTWADWVCRGNSYGLGYSRKSLVAKVMEIGCLIHQGTYQHVLCTHEQAEEIETIISKLAEHNTLLADVLRQYYVGIGSMREKAKRMGISHSHFKVSLDMARQWVAGWLSAT